MTAPRDLFDRVFGRKRLDAARDRLYTLAGQRGFRIAVAVALVCLHFIAFTIASHDRLGAPFNAAPGEAPYYSNPHVGELAGYPRQPHRWSRLAVSRWDAQHSIGVAVRGLSAWVAMPSAITGADRPM